MLPNGKDWVTSGEDRTVRVWKDNEVSQTIYHPAISVWSVCCLPNGDIVSGASDGMIRVFSTDPGRHASQEVQEIFEAELSKLALAAQQELGGVKLSDLPGPEALFEPGRKDGQTKMVRDGEAVSVHSWSMAEQKWTKVGDVVGAAGGTTETSGKKLHQGKEYDYVFDIEIDEPKSTLKLPFNVTDDPYMAAQQFIHKNELSQYYLEEIATHIMKNTGGQNLGALKNEDPFTGGASYTIESGGSGATATDFSSRGAADPFTGSGAYTSGSGGVETGTRGAPPPDPWMEGAYKTSDSGTGSGSGPVVDMDVEETNQYFPIAEFLSFDQGIKSEAMLKKLRELNSQVPEDKQLTDAELENLPNVALAEAENTEGVASMLKILSWDAAHIFPCLDLIRLVLLHPNNKKCIVEKTFLDTLFSVCLANLTKQSPTANQFLSLRVLSNLFSVQEGLDFLLVYRESVISRLLENIVDNENKNVQIGAATLFLNFAVALARQPATTEEGQIQVLSGLSINCISFITDWEARFRILVAIGTILTISKDNIEYANTLEVKEGVRGWKVLEGPEKCTGCAQSIMNLL
jgi:phospholipase A-2-activating protein